MESKPKYKIAIIQPFVPSYRSAFFVGLSERFDVDIYTYQCEGYIKKNKFQLSELPVKKLKSVKIGRAILVNFIPIFFRKDYQIIVLGAELKILSNWIFLIIGKLLNKKVILWGHGLDARFYIKQQSRMPKVLKIMYALSAGAWFYTKNEKIIWENILPKLKSVYLMNTVNVPLVYKPTNESQSENLKKNMTLLQV